MIALHKLGFWTKENSKLPYFSNNNINIGNSNLNQDNTNVAEAGRVLKLHFNQTWAKNETFDAAISRSSRRSMGYEIAHLKN